MTPNYQLKNSRCPLVGRRLLISRSTVGLSMAFSQSTVSSSLLVHISADRWLTVDQELVHCWGTVGQCFSYYKPYSFLLNKSFCLLTKRLKQGSTKPWISFMVLWTTGNCVLFLSCTCEQTFKIVVIKHCTFQSNLAQIHALDQSHLLVCY